MIPSVDKTVHYLDAVSKAAHVIDFADVHYEMTPKEEFRIRPSTFFKDYCLGCGQCCRNWDTVFFPSDLDELYRQRDAGSEAHAEYLDVMQEANIYIDGKEKKYYSAPSVFLRDSHHIWVDSHTTLNCRWIYIEDGKKLCKIHNYRCITCGFPHMELYMNHVRTHGFLGHKQFGRNNHLGCKVDIKKNHMDQVTLHSNIYWLERLQVVADYFGLSTYLPEIIDYMKHVDLNNLPTLDVTFNPFPSKRKLFDL